MIVDNDKIYLNNTDSQCNHNQFPNNLRDKIKCRRLMKHKNNNKRTVSVDYGRKSVKLFIIIK